jgi:Uma2 family endonuclease
MPPVRLIRPRVSYADLQRAPEDGHRYELYDGEVFVVPAPIPLHQVVVHRMGNLLKAFADRHGGIVLLSPVDIVFSEFDVVQPDVVFFERDRTHLIDLWQPIRVPPDLAVEVLSPTTAATDRGKKMQMLARYGVREYWLLEPKARTVEVHWLAGDAYALAQSASDSETARSTILKDFAVDVAILFDVHGSGGTR